MISENVGLEGQSANGVIKLEAWAQPSGPAKAGWAELLSSAHLPIGGLTCFRWWRCRRSRRCRRFPSRRQSDPITARFRGWFRFETSASFPLALQRIKFLKDPREVPPQSQQLKFKGSTIDLD